MVSLPQDGLVAVVKRDCPTCELTAPVLGELARRAGLTVFTQDDPTFPDTVPAPVHDLALDMSHRLKIEIVPTLIRLEGGREIARTYGWDRGEWERLTGVVGLGDGLPLVPPSEERVLRMLDGTARDPQEVIGLVPPALNAATVEKIAVNAVMAGCKPEYLPVVLAAVEAVLDEGFAMHGVLATTMFVGPVVVVNGPIRRRIGMNAKGNALGQGNRANLAIGRALQLVIRNIGEGRPQEVDRATLGNPGKLGYCFAEDEEGSCWEPLSAERGVKPGVSAVTVFAGFGLQGVVDQKSRTPESLARSMAESLKAIHSVKLAPSCDALLVVCPEHERTFREAGWSKARLYEELYKLCEIPGEELIAGAKGIAEGGPPSLAGKIVNKFRPGGLMIVRAGGNAGMFSGIIGGWSAGGPRGSIPVTKEVRP